MADIVDDANAIIDRQIANALEARRRAANVKGSEYCVECDDDMPLPRQQLGFNLCVSCAEEAERRKSLYAE